MLKMLLSLLVCSQLFAETKSNNIPFRLQWMHNHGYCGEVSLINAGLYYGQYVSQYDVRACATADGTQTGGQLLIGINDVGTAEKLHLSSLEWNTRSEPTTDVFLVWVKEQIANGYPVALGVFANQYLFYGETDPQAGDPLYDHIVTAMYISSNHPLTDPTYYGNDEIGFSDHGLWDNDEAPIYYFNASFDPFQADRAQANSPNGPIYSLDNQAINYAIAITGVKDLNGDTVPVRVDTDLNYEKPEIGVSSNTRPQPMPLTLTITVSGLEPNTPYILYRYNNLTSVPDSDFNKHASQAFEKWPFEIQAGSSYTQIEKIQSDEMAIYRCVKASAP